MKQVLANNYLFWVLLLIISLAGGSYIFYATAVGPWAFTDSAIYVVSSVNWSHGNGLGYESVNGSFIRLQHYPPGYSVLLGLFNFLLKSPVDSARWIDIFSFALLIFCGALILWKTSRSKLFALCYAVVILFSYYLVIQFTGVMSEPAAILAGSLSLLLLVLYQKEQKIWVLALSGFLAAGAVLIRYQQFGVPLTGAVYLLLFAQGKWKSKFLNVLMYGLCAAVPVCAWFLTSYLGMHSFGAREIAIQGSFSQITGEFLRNVYNAVKYWFPYRSNLVHWFNPTLARGLLLLFFVAISAVGIHKGLKSGKQVFLANPAFQFVLVSVSFVVIEVVFLWLALFISSPPPAINSRMLSSLIPMMVVTIFGLEVLFAQAIKRQLWPILVMIFTTALFVIDFYPQVKEHAVLMHGYGEGLTSVPYTNSTLISKLKNLPEDRPIISNSPASIIFHVYREPYQTFAVENDAFLDLTQQYGDQNSNAQKAFREECGALVIFDPLIVDKIDLDAGLHFPSSAYHVTDGLIKLYEDDLGTLYVYPGCESSYSSLN